MVGELSETEVMTAPKIRCRFECVTVTERKGWGENKLLYSAEFAVVTSGSEENKKFFASTPSGKIEVSTVAKDHFRVGQVYDVDFTPVL